MTSIVRSSGFLGSFSPGGVSALVVPGGASLARSFNGTSDQIDIGTHTWDPTTTATFSHWINITALPSSVAGLFAPGAFVTNYQEWVLNSTGTLSAFFNNNWGGTSGNPIPSSPTLSTGIWYHLAWTCDGSNFNFYFNGTLTGAGFGLGTSGLGSNSLDQFLGNDARAGGRNFNGYMTDIALWNIALSAGQISNLASGTRSNKVGSNGSFVGYWPITGRSPEPDYSGNGFNGVLTGTTIVAGPPQLQPF